MLERLRGLMQGTSPARVIKAPKMSLARGLRLTLFGDPSFSFRLDHSRIFAITFGMVGMMLDTTDLMVGRTFGCVAG